MMMSGFKEGIIEMAVVALLFLHENEEISNNIHCLLHESYYGQVVLFKF